MIAEKSRTLIGLKCNFCPSLRYTRSEYTKYSFARDALTGTKISILNLQGNREKEFLSEKGVAKRSNTGVLQATRLSLRRKVDISTMSVQLFSAILLVIQSLKQGGRHTTAVTAVQIHRNVAGKDLIVLTQCAGDDGEGIGNTVLRITEGQFGNRCQ